MGGEGRLAGPLACFLVTQFRGLSEEVGIPASWR